jgi:ATP-dependent helicase HrpA
VGFAARVKGLNGEMSRLMDARDLDDCLLADRHALRKRLAGLERRRQGGQPIDAGLEQLRADLQRSRARVAERRQALMQIDFPAALPISARRAEIAGLIEAHQVVILCGETGSGKSTQLPKICLSLQRGILGRIGHTQPRRIAARSLAGRIASELGCELGSLVGYKVRFKDRVSSRSRVKLLTDGMLLAEVQGDRWLNEYDTLIIDEAHERSLNIDFLLGYLKQLLPRRPDLKLIVTSATIDPQRFSAFFQQAPVINVSGRNFPVELRYRPPEEAGARERDDSLQQALVEAVDELAREPWGDILVFLSGEREIREAAETLRQHRHKGIQILPLFARQSSAEQALIFRPDGSRRIILATNVAETSLTVPGIRHVIDAGYARISRYSHKSKVQRLPVEPVSRASADQRKGRCGRVAEGICIRLYSEEDFAGRAEFTEPEIQRTNLASVILQMKLLGFGDIADFAFLDPPDHRLVKDGYLVLEEIGALNADGSVSPPGMQIARLPVDPRIGRMVLAAAAQGCLREVLVIAAALSVQDPRDRPMEKQQQADEAHALFKDESSDFIGFLKLWEYLEEKRRHLSRRKFQALCKRHFLSPNRVHEWIDIHQQLRLQTHTLGFHENAQVADHAAVHRALLSGLLSHIGCRAPGKEKGYQGARNSRFYSFPGSGLFTSQPKWVMAAELVETSRLYARTLAAIEPQWLERAAAHLLQRSYAEPHWQSRRGQVAAFEKVSLYGLVIVPRRRINYGPINPVEARELFIRSALVDGDFDSRAPFWRHNRELIEQVHEMEAKARRRDILVDEERLYLFYQERIPAGIYSTPQFDKWLRGVSRQQPKLLHLRLEDIMREQAGVLDEAAFPNRMDFSGLALPLRYAFEPGRADDGATLVIPLAALNQVSAQRAQWGVAGQLQERITALLRGLPKSLRKSFVPVPDYAARLAAALQPCDRPLLRTLGEELRRISGVQVAEDAWDLEALPAHLQLNYRVVDDAGHTLAEDRDLAGLKKRFANQTGEAFHRVSSELPECGGMRAWTCGEIPEEMAIERAGVQLMGFPALVDEGDTVALRVLDSAEKAAAAHRQGLRRLFLIGLGPTARYLKKNLPDLQRMALQYARAEARTQGPHKDLQQALIELVIDRCFIEGQGPIRDAPAFSRSLQQGQQTLMAQAGELCGLVADILEVYQRVRQLLAARNEINWLESLNDMRQQLNRLVYRGFLHEVGHAQLQAYPRYLRALELRLGKLPQAAARDVRQLRQMLPMWRDWQVLYDKSLASGHADERLESLRWMFEELRVSLFAQEVGTAYPVSLKRIDKRRREMGF